MGKHFRFGLLIFSQIPKLVTPPPLHSTPVPPQGFVVPFLFLNTFCNCVIEMRFHISVFPLMKLKRMRPKKVCFVLLLMQIGFTNFERTRCVNPFSLQSLSEPFPPQSKQLYLVRFSFDFTQKTGK